MESNKKATWSHSMSATAGFLGGVVVCAAVFLGMMRSQNDESVSFETQSVNRTVQATSIRELNSWNYQYNNVISHYDDPSLPTVPTCTVSATATSPNAPGTIGFTVTVDDPYPNAVPHKNVNQSTQVRCGLYSTGSTGGEGKFVTIADINWYEGDFVNVPVGNRYGVVCMAKLWRNPWYTSRVCTTNTDIAISNAPVAPPTNPSQPNNPNGTTVTPFPNQPNNPINPNNQNQPNNPVVPNPGTNTNAGTPPVAFDLELGAGVNGGGVGQAFQYFFKVSNNGPGLASNFVLKVYPQGLINIAANGGVLNGNAYVYAIPNLGPNAGVAFTLEGFDNPAIATDAHVVAELCNYSLNDTDSKPCNMVNLTPVEDDEAQA